MDTDIYGEKTIWRHGKDGRLQAKERKASEETNTANTLILDFWSPELWENKFLSLKAPNLWCFAKAALEN